MSSGIGPMRTEAQQMEAARAGATVHGLEVSAWVHLTRPLWYICVTVGAWFPTQHSR